MHIEISALQNIFLHGSADDRVAALQAQHPADLAAALQTLEPAAAWDVLLQASTPRQAAVFGYLDPAFQTLLAAVTPRRDLAAIVMGMKADDRADLYKKLSHEQRGALMPALAQAEREDIRRLASYAEGTAGAIMTSAYAALPPGVSATTALTVLRREAPDKETIYRAYVLSRLRDRP